MRDYFEARVGRFAQLQHEFNRRLKDFERRAAKKPFFCADEAWVGAIDEEIFGCKLRSISGPAKAFALI